MSDKIQPKSFLTSYNYITASAQMYLLRDLPGSRKQPESLINTNNYSKNIEASWNVEMQTRREKTRPSFQERASMKSYAEKSK